MRQKNPFAIQTLEPRCLLSAVTVSGSSGADEFRVYVASNTIIVEVDGFGNSYPDFLYDGIVIESLGGADSIIIDSNTDNPVTVNGGSGVDTIEIGKTSSTLDGIESAISITNASADRLYIHGEADLFGATYSINGATITKSGYPVINTGDSALVAVLAGGGADTFDVTGTGANNRYELRGGGEADVFAVRSTNGATVVVDGEAGFDRIELNSDVGTPATIIFEVTQDLARMDSEAGGIVRVEGSAGIFMNTNQSFFEGDLFLDRGFMIERNSQAAGGLGYWRQRLIDAQTNVTPQVRSIYADASAANDAVGYGYAQDGSLTTLGGFDLLASDLVLRYTLRGDANLDGTVTFDDLLVVAQNYSASATGKVWTTGDFDLNSKSDFDDLLALAQCYGQTALLTREVGSRGVVRRGIFA